MLLPELNWEKDLNKRAPANFLLVNSIGRPDFIMTMLVVVIVAFLVVILFWIGLNSMTILLQVQTSSEAEARRAFQIADLMRTFNEQAQIIILGLASSVFTLAGAYYLRRSSYDKNDVEREQIQFENATRTSGVGGIAGAVSSASEGFVENTETTLSHPNYDDEEEDI